MNNGQYEHESSYLIKQVVTQLYLLPWICWRPTQGLIKHCRDCQRGENIGYLIPGPGGHLFYGDLMQHISHYFTFTQSTLSLAVLGKWTKKYCRDSCRTFQER